MSERTILVVEDDAALREALQETLLRAGYVVATANWTFNTTDDGTDAFCSLMDVPNAAEGPYGYAYSGTIFGTYFYDATSLTRTIPVPAGNTTIYLNCYERIGDMYVIYPNITAVFVPNRY